MSRIDSILDIAKSYIGIAEGSAKHSEIISYYNKARYGDAYKMTMNDPWCAAFVVACFARANCEDLIPCVASCDQMISYFKQWGRFYRPSQIGITRGDIIFYNWDQDSSVDHVGIVVRNVFGRIQAIEGNKSDTVTYREIGIDSPLIVGVAKPAYDSQSNGHSEIPPINQYTEYYRTFSYDDRKTIFSLPLLQKGSSGVYVRILQILLKYNGNFNLDVTGQFDEETNNVVLSWQLIKNLETDGVVGKETWASLLK